MAAQPHSLPSTLSPLDRDRMHRAAELLLRARRERKPIHHLPEQLRPADLTEAYALQDIVAIACAPIAGWKVGAPSPQDTPLFSPMPAWGGYAHSGQRISRNYHRYGGIEAEIAFRLSQDLPARAQPYTLGEVIAAIGSAHPAIEILESAFADPDQTDRLSVVGDLQMNGGFAFGPPLPEWQSIDLAQESVTVLVDNEVRFQGIASNTAGTDLLRLVVWLANDGSGRTAGLRAGDWITTGSWSGKTFALPGQTARASFVHFGECVVGFD
ncbi:MAG TPA: 2-keto-4-pentenoate hydratase [Acidobacteriaceae bacterium]|nr:2-keto-4-pentenoate hydratase [Acidobacteriaceae bacterium]